MEPDNIQKSCFSTIKKDKIFNVRKVPYKQFDNQKYLKPSFSPYFSKQNVDQSLTSSITKKGGQYHFQVAIIQSPAYKQLTKKYTAIKQEQIKQRQKHLEQLKIKEQQLNKFRAQKQRILNQRNKIIEKRDQLKLKIQEIRQKNQMLRSQHIERTQQYRIMNMEYLRNMVIGMRYQNGYDIDTDNMTYQQLLQLQQKIGNVNKGLTPQQIQKLPKRIYKSTDSQQLCSICYYNAKQEQQLLILPCKHIYHSQCIKQWLMKEKMCPMCKQQIIIEKNQTQKQNQQQIQKNEETMLVSDKNQRQNQNQQNKVQEQVNENVDLQSLNEGRIVYK